MIVGSQREHSGSECDRLAGRIGFSIITKKVTLHSVLVKAVSVIVLQPKSS